ncbi:Poly [ADP-ribose] polymerase 6 [Balamuthia mandrillaris]
MRHGEVVMSLYGTDTIQVYPFIDSVRIQLDVAPLNSEVQKKMGVDPEYHSKIVLSTQFGSGDYMADKRIPQVKVIHPKAKGKADEEVKCGLGEQMENVARQFMERVWNSLHVEHEGRPVQKLMAMGWDKNTCQFAWETCNYDYEAAVSWLSDNVPLLRGLNTESSSSSASSTPVMRDKKSKGKSSIKSTKKDKGKGKGKEKEKDKEKEKKESKKDKKTSKKLKRKKSTPKTSRAITPAVKEQQALVTRKKEKLENYFTKDCHQLGVAIALTQNNMDVEKACNQILDAGGSVEGIQLLSDPQETFKDRNMLLELTTYLVRRLPNCIGYCLICDKRIINEEITDPTICTIGTCQFNYIELGVCDSIPMTFCPSSISNDILNNPDVVDLYISMIVAAATSHRKGDIFDPFPPFYESHGTKQYDEVVRVLDMVPSVDDMKKRCGSEKELITYLSSIDNNGAIYRLLSWILSVNRSAMLLLPPNLQLEAMRTKHQYMLTAETNPTKTATFKAWRKQYGSYFAFHGSGIENWHSILRKGLLNCSGTKLQTTGQAYGPGVYLAPDSATSMGYARTGRAWSKSRFGDSSSLTCMAIAEVVKHPDVPHTPNPYYVVRNADCVATRFFLFYPGGNSGVNVQAKDLNLDKYV